MLQYNIFGMVFSLYKSRNLSPCQKCCMYNIYGRPLQIILTGNLSHARLLCAKCCTCSNFSRVIQPQPHVSAVYLCISMLQQMIMKHCSHGYESIESRCSSPIPRLETLCCLKFVSRVCEQKKEGNTRFSRNIAHSWQQLQLQAVQWTLLPGVIHHPFPGGKVAAFKMCKPLCLCSLCEPARVAGDLSPGVGTGGNWCRGQCGGSPSLGQGLLHLPGGYCHLVLIKST